MNALPPDGPAPELAVPVGTVCFIIEKLRAYENADLMGEPAEAPDGQDPQANPLDCDDLDALHAQENAYHGAPVLQELESFIGDLPEDQQVDLVALMWLGRDNYVSSEWTAVRDQAAQAHNARTPAYLLGSPMAADLLQEGLAILGFTCTDEDGPAAD